MGGRARRVEIIHRAKSQPCSDCGRSYPPWVMHFDHVRGTKRFNISNAADQHGVAALLLEIAKCEVVCANCHAERTHRRRCNPTL